jgi:hypothetical protein
VENTREAHRLLLDLRIEPVVDVWAERMRLWISSKILAPLVDSFEQLDTVGMSMSTPIQVPGGDTHSTFNAQNNFWSAQVGRRASDDGGGVLVCLVRDVGVLDVVTFRVCFVLSYWLCVSFSDIPPPPPPPPLCVYVCYVCCSNAP